LKQPPVIPSIPVICTSRGRFGGVRHHGWPQLGLRGVFPERAVDHQHDIACRIGRRSDKGADSTRQCNAFRQDTVKNLHWRKVSEFFPRPSVDFNLYLFDLQVTNIVKILFFRNILPNQTVCIFVATALPRIVWTFKIKISVKFF